MKCSQKSNFGQSNRYFRFSLTRSKAGFHGFELPTVIAAKTNETKDHQSDPNKRRNFSHIKNYREFRNGYPLRMNECRIKTVGTARQLVVERRMGDQTDCCQQTVLHWLAEFDDLARTHGGFDLLHIFNIMSRIQLFLRPCLDDIASEVYYRRTPY